MTTAKPTPAATLREKIREAIHDHCSDHPNTGDGPIADAVLSAVREHLMSEMVVARAAYALEAAEKDLNKDEYQCMSAALLAALGDA